MLDGEVVLCLGCEEVSDDILGVLNLGWERVKIILCVEIEVYAVVSKSLHVCLTSRSGITL